MIRRLAGLRNPLSGIEAFPIGTEMKMAANPRRWIWATDFTVR
jgi:hypothetical protein